MRLARTFVPDLLEQLFNRRVSRFISHDDQNLRRGIARDVRTGCREPWGCTPSVGGNLDRCAGSRVSYPRSGAARKTGGASLRGAIRVVRRTLRPSGNFGRVARMRSWVDALGCITPACIFRGRPGSASESPPPLPVDSQPAKEPPGRSLLGSLRGGTKPAPLGSASRKGCGGKQRESTAPSISRAPWVLECRARRRRRCFLLVAPSFGDRNDLEIRPETFAAALQRCSHEAATAIAV